ncbi:putative endoribonuclease L-PSP [Campylobacter coli JV20]|nr:putative endoribonuclease L-PSP [Campylobacter coli JV20]
MIKYVYLIYINKKGEKMSNYPKAIGPYSAYREANGLLFISGQLPINPASGEIESSDIKEQTKQSLKNIGAILEENGISYDKVIKTTCFLADINDFVAFNEIYAEFFKAPYPARSAFAVKDLPKKAKVEIEIIAQKG